jgi:hypothetical protein
MYREFWEAGYRVFPLFGADKNGKCECGDPECDPKALYKHPRIGNWQHTPEWDEEQLSNFEEFGWIKTGYGVLCAGLLVIDVDARNGGVESLAKLTHDYPSINESRLEVATGSGGGSKHIYFSLSEPAALIQSHKDYPGIDFKSSGYVVGPGSRHASGGCYEADGYPSEINEAPADIIELLRKPERHRADYNGTPLDVSYDDIEEMLSAIPNHGLDYEVWVRVGMAVHHATDGTGYNLWENWSATSEKHNPNHMPNKWHSFGRSANPVTIGTLIHHAQEHGWIMPIRMMDGMGELPEISMKEPDPVDGLPFDISGIDLTQPPGFVGDVARWIESQSRRPRRHLSAAAAITAIGNIAGLRYTDDRDGVTTNMLTFCVAGSRTGKESIQQAVFTLHKAAGIMPASHGGIKSEQEIVKNLTRHQASFYIIDEVGLTLQKIHNAIKRGGAVYLEGVIAMIMSVQSKAHGYMMLNGDLKEKLREDLSKELSQIISKMDKGETPYLLSQQQMLENALMNVDQGLDRPFLSLIGFTTPSTFEKLVDKESATNGFFGRAVLFQEHDTVPKLKDDFVKTEMNSSIEMTVRAIFSDGDYDGQKYRIENYRPRSIVPSDAKANEMLGLVGKWMQAKAEDEASRHGLEALWLGAYEIVSKISLILAVPGMLRTAEHVRWAFAVVKRDVESKIRLAIGNDEAKPKKNDALRARIEGLCQEITTEGIITNRLDKTFAKADILKALDDMTQAKILIRTITIHAKKKTEVKKYEVRH